MSNSGVHKKLQTTPFIQFMVVDCSNSINHNWEQVLHYSKVWLDFMVRGSINKFPDFFRMGTFIDSTHMKL